MPHSGSDSTYPTVQICGTTSDLMATLESKTTESPNQDLRRHIESINRVRRIFEHRDGIVTEFDADGDGCVVMSWRSNEVWIVDDGGEKQIFEFPTPVLVHPARVEIRTPNTEHRYLVGETIELKPQRLTEIGSTFVWHVQDVVKVLQRTLENIPKPPDSEGN